MPTSKYSPKQKRIAAVAPPRNKITKADFDKLKKMKRYLKRIWCALRNRKCNPECECC